ncbi:MAG: rRNA maturation RNase YbeY [Proteobacteria bacterium]|nr:MAG: rRNA maturation RNase YbeY [Pseudomonadota bacterium]
MEDIRRFVAAAVCHCAVDRDEVAIRFVRETEMRDVNLKYRGKDASTNVLSFAFEDPPGVASRILGDLLISPAVVRREALAQSKAVQEHFAHLIVHGTLHLCGYDHDTDEDAARMEALEVEILGDLGVNNPY